MGKIAMPKEQQVCMLVKLFFVDDEPEFQRYMVFWIWEIYTKS